MTVTAAVTRNAVTTTPTLGARGRRLWRELTDGREVPPPDRVLIEEACRTADRLDRLDAILSGDPGEWMSLAAVAEDGSVVKVVVTGALVEVRQQQLALKALLGELRQSRAAAGKPAQSGGRGADTRQQPAAGGGARVGGVSDLTARIAARRNEAQG